MLRPPIAVDEIGTRARLDRLAAVVRREAETAEANSFDEAMPAALKGEADAPAELEARDAGAAGVG